MTVWQPGMGHAECAKQRERGKMHTDPYDIVYPSGEMFEIPNTARGRWRRRQLYREMLRVMLHTGERILEVEWAFRRPIMDSSQTRVDPTIVRNLARTWGWTL